MATTTIPGGRVESHNDRLRQVEQEAVLDMGFQAGVSAVLPVPPGLLLTDVLEDC